VAEDNLVFKPPFLGPQMAKGIALDDLAGYVNETALFRNQWQFRPVKGESDADFKVRILGRCCGRNWPRPRRPGHRSRRWLGATSRSTPTATT
jgi:hypothetical protein